jgi:DNA-binding MarR family transcriptional regulator
MRYAERIGAVGLTAAQSGMLRTIAAGEGMSQKALAAALGVLPSRLVLLVDDLEERGLLERRDSADDRRVYELFLSEKGRRALDDVGRVARAHDEAFLSPLDDRERDELRRLLGKLADHEGLTPGVHPGYRHVASPPSRETSKRAKPKRRS